MTILLLHNRYLWPGGEDAVFESETALLRGRGHHVAHHLGDNRSAVDAGRLAVLGAMFRGAWSREAYSKMQERVKESSPEIVHAHNLWYALSPSVLSAAHDLGVPTVLTLHNFRFLCPGAVLLDRQGRPCQDCVEHGLWRGVLRRCYHDSFLASVAVARLSRLNSRRGTWARDVDLFIVPSEFCREVFVRGGFPAEKIVVKPNFVEDPLDGAAEPAPEPAGAARVLFIGRLSREKGLRTLLAAWARVEQETGAELRLVGDGPMLAELRTLAGELKVSFAGRAEGDALIREIAQAHLSVLPSECYETFGRVVVESYAAGRPAVVSNIGGPAELVIDGETGLLFEPGNADDLASKLTAILTDAERRRSMGQAARRAYLARYTLDQNYQQLMDCYQQAMESHKRCSP